MTNPTNEHREQARTLPDKCIHCDESIVVLHSPSFLARCYEGYMHHEEAKDTILQALSSRDGDIRAGNLRAIPRVNTLLVALRKIRDNAPTLEAAEALAAIAIEEFVEGG